MNTTVRPSCALAWRLAVIACLCPQAASADFLLFNTFGNEVSQHFRADGTLRRNYTTQQFGEEANATHVLSPDKEILYVFSNSLGRADVIPFDVNTGAALVELRPGTNLILNVTGDAVDFQTQLCCENRPNAVLRASSPIYQPNPHSRRLSNLPELFVVSNPFDSFPPPASQIKRFDGITGEFIESIDAPLPGMQIADIALDATGVLYAATNAGIYTYQNQFGSYGQKIIPPLLRVPGVTGDMAFGPDNTLFVRENGSGNINRYHATGILLSTFLTPADLGVDQLGWIEFAPDGTLYVTSHKNNPGRVPDSYLSFINGSSRQILSTVRIGPGDVNFHGPPLLALPVVPEAVTWTMAAIAGFVAQFLYRRTR